MTFVPRSCWEKQIRVICTSLANLQESGSESRHREYSCEGSGNIEAWEQGNFSTPQLGRVLRLEGGGLAGLRGRFRAGWVVTTGPAPPAEGLRVEG